MVRYSSRRRLTTVSGGATVRRYGGPSADEVMAARGRSRTRSVSGSRLGKRVRTISVTRSRRVPKGKKLSLSRSYAYKKSRLANKRPRPILQVPILLDRMQGVKLEDPLEDPNDANIALPGYYPLNKGDAATVGDCPY